MDADKGVVKYKKTIIFPASLDSDAVKIIRRLCKFGHTSFLVGGCVRDLLLGKIPKDFDISTSARPRQIKRIFKNARIIGRRFRLVHIIFRDKIIEVSTFRKSPEKATENFKSDGLLIVRDNTYGDERDDALRRDFTINGLFYDIKNEEVLDYTNGVKDIQRRIIRTIGDPDIRFQEDPVRILRAIRFSCRLNLDICSESMKAMGKYAEEITKSAAQRVTEEIIRLMACGASSKALQTMRNLGLTQILLPEVDKAFEHHSPFFDSQDNGWDFLLKIASNMDRLDKGRRRYGNAIFLALLFSHIGGLAITQARQRSEGSYFDPGKVLDTVLRPVSIRMGISRWDLNRIKQILIAIPKLSASSKRRRFKTNEYIQRDFFPDALIFYRLVKESTDNNMDRFRWWTDRFEKLKNNQDPSSRGRPHSRSRRRRRRVKPKSPRHSGTIKRDKKRP